MEYQFIRDPISGLRIKISSEHAVIGRWLNEEVGKEKIAMVQALISAVKSSNEPLTLQGQEVDLILSKDEALFEAHALHQDNEDLVAYQDDDLMLEEEGLCSGCGFEDFVELIESWGFVHHVVPFARSGQRPLNEFKTLFIFTTGLLLF